MKVTEIECRSILNRSALADYTINCYRGCEHGCRYCYARFITRFAPHQEPWGHFVDVKLNAVELLKRQIRRAKPGTVYISSVCDGWQPLEAKYQLTRGCLEILVYHYYPITILTKSALAARDLDLLKGDVELGVTLTTLDETLRTEIEPKASPTEERISLLERAKERGIVTYAFLGPFMPYLSDGEENLDGLLRRLDEVGIDYFYVDRLNPRPNVWASLRDLLQERHPFLIDDYRKILFDEGTRMQYSARLIATISRLARKYGLEDKMRLCFT